MRRIALIVIIMCMVLPIILSACTPAHDHEYTEKITKQPTCKDVGEKTFTCSVCNKTYTEEIPVTDEHEYTEAVIKEPTCTEEGEKTLTCSVCGETHNETIAETGHKWKEKITKAATCTKSGKKTLTCSVCGEKKTEKIAAKGHQWVDATCTKARKCSACGKKQGKALGHAYGVSGYCGRCNKYKGTTERHEKEITGTWVAVLKNNEKTDEHLVIELWSTGKATVEWGGPPAYVGKWSFSTEYHGTMNLYCYTIRIKGYSDILMNYMYDKPQRYLGVELGGDNYFLKKQ